MMIDLSTRPLTAAELKALKARLRSLNVCHTAAATALGVSPETLQSALQGQRVQCAKRERMLGK